VGLLDREQTADRAGRPGVEVIDGAAARPAVVGGRCVGSLGRLFFPDSVGLHTVELPDRRGALPETGSPATPDFQEATDEP